jgi:hypothetical protein
MPQVTVQLLQLPDTSFVYGTVTDNEGWVTIKKVPQGEYLLRYSFMGYNTVDFDFKVLKEDRDRQLGVFKMYESSIMLTEAVIEDALPPTQVVDDTLMYNVSAFRVPEGSVLEELIKRLPGVEVDENGGITVNGRTVSRILVDGQEYFGNDRQMATKNLPVNIIRRIKTYQRQSDLARITGVDDGEEETGDDGADDLEHDVADEILDGEFLVEEHGDGDGGIEVAPRDLPDSDGHDHDGQTEGESTADEVVTRLHSEEKGSDTEEHESEGAEELSEVFSDAVIH